ncbi:hypothetical protein J6524_12640 [Bradyrhizobium sp. WSM 1738]|uniref:hypothetical protein n=1 Tax=Bradyrhizobium hereditatis TaxID=2821405 RepID=UPI001CE25017|nr:hypothetical protein [Bradyrhizobium hereditatis]MCA6115733.1 hypothetical protein [Bradyrhizobium hereditatis]
MKRAFVFLVLAPVTVFFAALMIWVATAGPRDLDFACVVAVVLSILTLPMSAISWISDEFLVRAFPISLRVYLIAMVGATAATAEILAVFSSLFPPSIVMALATGGAIVMAACSLLSHDYSGGQRRCLEPARA